MAKGMTKGELLDYLERAASRYRTDALPSLLRNRCHMGSELTEDDIHRVRGELRFFQRFIDTVLVDFINHVGSELGGNRGERVEHIKTRCED